MKTSAVSRISAQLPNPKKARFNLSHDVNTTYDWGSVQPLFGKMLLPDSSINVNLEQLTRLAPMVVPTFGRVKLKNIAHFVPIQEIFPNWQALLSQTKVTRTGLNGSNASTNTYVPKYVPCVPTNILTSFLLVGSKVNVYFSGTAGSSDWDSWTCVRNTGTYTTPAGWPTATQAIRGLLYGVLDIHYNASATTLSDFNYTGIVFNPRRLPLNPNGGCMLPNGCPLLSMPSISTQTCQYLSNANGSGYTHSAGNEQNTHNLYYGDNHISFEGSDLIWEYGGDTGITSAMRASGSGTPFDGVSETFFDSRRVRFVFKLSSFGKRLRKILIGLGYDVNLSNSDMVSILPLVAFYKAWWDSYAPERYMNFYETPCWKLINASMYSTNSARLDLSLFATSTNSIMEYFRQFIADLGTCFATERLDVISAATDNYYSQTNTTADAFGHDEIQRAIAGVLQQQISNPSVISGGSTWYASGGENSFEGYGMNDNNVTNPDTNMIHLILQGSTNTLTQPQIDALKKAYFMLNKCSQAGMKVEEILRALGFGDYVEECKGRFINASDEPIKISDVVATASTSEAKLGQYGGRGLGVGNFQFSFNAKEHGFLIVLSSIVPESGYINAPSVENEAYTFDRLYNPEFDGLAYEAIQKKNLVGSPLINDVSYKDTFGYLPTYTQWKFMSNKANGDFSLNSMKNSMTPYTLDKYIPVSDVGVYRSYIDSVNHVGSAVEDTNPTFHYSDLPNAGEDWRYINKFPWNGNYNRIFNAVDDGLEWSVYSPNNNAFLFLSFEYDNFMTHNVFSIDYWAHMKPIEDSYGTYDSEHSAPNTTIKKA